MKKTGIIRRIDELGRIVVPKELRKSLRLKVGDYLEIYVDKEDIVLKKHSELASIKDFANVLTESMYTDIKKNIMITDRDEILAYDGKNKKEFLHKKIGKDIVDAIEKRKDIVEKYEKKFTFTDKCELTCTYAISTIISGGIEIGTVIIFDEEKKVDEIDYKIAHIISKFLSKHLEQE